jgi:membrane-associated phospholipid phosphatase
MFRQRFAACLVVVVTAASPVAADVVTDWNSIWMDCVRATGGSPCPVTRTGAMMHAAIYDAVNSISRTHEPYLGFLAVPTGTSQEAAAAQAAHDVLAEVFPARRAVLDAALLGSLEAILDARAKRNGVLLGVAAARAVIEARRDDGSDPAASYAVHSGPGAWRPTPPDYTPALSPNWGRVKPWTTIRADQFRPRFMRGLTEMGAILTDPEYTRAFQQVKELGALASPKRTEYETQTAFFWANDVNDTYKPPGHLNHIAQVLARQQRLGLSETARLFALLNIGLADAAIVAWDCKFEAGMDLWRPIAAIHEAATDGNPDTEADPTWEPLAPFTPAFPAYISGHATFAATAAAVFTHFFGTDRLRHTISTDDPRYTGAARTYDSFLEEARENAQSRIYLGVHWQFDTDDGLLAGTALGNYVSGSILRPQTTSPRVAHRLQIAPMGREPWEGLGIIVAGPGDLNADGYDDVFIGAFLSDAVGVDGGRAYVHFGGPGMSTTPSLTLNGQAAGDNFGLVGSAGDVNGDGHPDLIVGANMNDAFGTSVGRAYLYFGGPGMDAIADWTVTGEASNDLFGSRVAGVGDVNGDGYDDVIVGAIANSSRRGRAYLYLGGPGMDDVADLTMTGEAAYDEFGLVGRAGDLNGDGYDDVVVGGWLADPGLPNRGRAYVYFGGPSMDSVADLTLNGEGAGDRFGVSVRCAGDVNGDGHDDLIVGAYLNDAGGIDNGRAYVYFGGPALDAVPDRILTGRESGAGFGKGVSGAGDVNQDGFDDVIVGEYVSDAGGYDSGRAHVFFGGPVMDDVSDMTITGEGAYDHLGYWVDGAGDLNADGFADVIVGAYHNDAGGFDAGRAYVYDFNRYFVRRPNGGEMWYVGATETISWLGAELADIWLSVDGGSSFQLLLGGVGGNDSNTVSVQVPNQPTQMAVIKITPANTTVAGLDRSDSPFTIQTPVSVEPGGLQGLSFAAPWPNPASRGTQLTLELRRQGRVTVSVFDLSGRLVATPIANEILPAGRTTRSWYPRRLAKGLYHLRAQVDQLEQVRKLAWLGD